MNRGYHEIKEHGKREFPFNIYPCSIPVDFSHVALHWHEEMEIIAVKKGKGRITVDTVSYPVEEGDILAGRDGFAFLYEMVYAVYIIDIQ